MQGSMAGLNSALLSSEFACQSAWLAVHACDPDKRLSRCVSPKDLYSMKCEIDLRVPWYYVIWLTWKCGREDRNGN